MYCTYMITINYMHYTVQQMTDMPIYTLHIYICHCWVMAGYFCIVPSRYHRTIFPLWLFSGKFPFIIKCICFFEPFTVSTSNIFTVFFRYIKFEHTFLLKLTTIYFQHCNVYVGYAKSLFAILYINGKLIK